MTSLPTLTAHWQQTLDWQPTLVQVAQFQHLYELILAGNQQLNLTRITAPDEFWEKHLWDSLRGIAQFLEADDSESADPSQGGDSQSGDSQSGDSQSGDSQSGDSQSDDSQSGDFHQGDDAGDDSQDDSELSPASLPPGSSVVQLPHRSFRAIDLGTGAGFPGIPIAIVQPTWKVTLLDSTRKKMQFLEGVLETLGLENARTWVDRAESIGQDPQHRQRYDLAMLRAVASATVGAEYALPLLRIGGLAILYRGQWSSAEETALTWAVQQLGGTIEAIEAFRTPLTEGERHCLYLRKVAATPAEYPRAIGIPTQKPMA